MKFSDLSSFNAFDWALVVIVVFSMFAGFRRGIVRTLLGIVGFVGGFLLACWDYNRLGEWLRQQRWVSSGTAAAIVAFLMLLEEGKVALRFEPDVTPDSPELAVALEKALRGEKEKHESDRASSGSGSVRALTAIY